jgi:hypothetical protein
LSQGNHETAEAIMSLINDYTTYRLDGQRRSELIAQANQDRLARGIRAESGSWWRRLLSHGGGGRRPVAAVPAHSHHLAG